MRIAQVSPLFESVPPKLYGGTERVVHYLTEELVALGNDVTLFASGDSTTSAALVATRERSLRTDESASDPLPHHVLQVDQVAARRRDFDLIHFHGDYLHFPLSRRLNFVQLTTLHGALSSPDLQPLYDEFHEMPVVSISDSQRAPLPQAHWIGTVHHGLPVELLRYSPRAEDYFAFLGRVSPEKGVDRAIEIALRLGVRIKIAAKVDKQDREYFTERIEPLLRHPTVEYVGEITEAEKATFLGRARALLFPIDWSEPFGLVLIEAMACGTPVVAFRRGSVPEVIDSGTTGFVVETVEEAVDAARGVSSLSRSRIREVFEKRFSARRMALDYLDLYAQLAERRSGRRYSVPRPAA